MLTQTFTYKNEPFKLADTYSINNKAIYNIDISNVRLGNGKLVADVTYKYDNKTTVNDEVVSFCSGSTPKNITDISIFTNDPVLLFKLFDRIDKYPTDLELTFTVDTPSQYAPQDVKDFYKSKLNAEAIKGFWNEIKEELNKRKEKDYKIEGELKQTLIKNILRSHLIAEKNNVAYAVISGCVLVGVLTPFGIFSHTVALALNIPMGIILAGATLAVVCMALTAIIATNIVARSKKQQAVALKKLGELENENIDTPKSRSHLVAKLEALYETDSKRDDFKNTIEMGQKSYNSYCERFKNLFTQNAYDPGYYVGQEMAAKMKA